MVRCAVPMRNRQVQSLRRRLARLPRGRGVRFPADLRAEVTAWITDRRAAGAWWSELERELGVSSVTLKRWATPRTGRMVAMRPVDVIDAPATETVTLVAPNGLRIEGVPVETAIAILRGLS